MLDTEWLHLRFSVGCLIFICLCWGSFVLASITHLLQAPAKHP